MYQNSLKFGLWITICVFLLVYLFNNGLSLSTDVVDHYDIVYSLQKYGILPNSGLSVIPNSYLIAAIFGSLFNSTFLGMQFTVLVSALIIWSVLGLALKNLPKNLFYLSSIFLFLFLFINKKHLFLFNTEIMGNFFFAHFVAQALALIFFVAALFLEKNTVNIWLRYIFLGLSIIVVENTHLLPAVELLGFLTLLITIDIFSTRKISFAALSCFFIGLLIIAIVFNPVFNTMRAISANNGAIGLRDIQTLQALSIFCIIVGTVSLFLTFKWLNFKDAKLQIKYLSLKYFGLMGLSISGLCLLQIILYKLGYGSEYACKKYGFGLSTFFIFNLSLTLSIIVNFKISPLFNRYAILGKLYSIVFIPLLIAITFSLTLLKTPSLFDVRDIVMLEKTIEKYKLSTLNQLPPNKYDYAVDLNDRGPGIIDSLLSRVILKTPALPDKNMLAIVTRSPFTEPEKIRYLLTLENKKWDIPHCRKQVLPHALVVIDSHCAFKQSV